MESSTKNANIECPHCGRKFNEKAASRHIAYCREKAILNAYKAGKGTQIQKGEEESLVNANQRGRNNNRG